MLQEPETNYNHKCTEIIEKIKKSKAKPFNQIVITSILYFTGIFSIIVVFFIILFLVRESLPWVNNEEGYTLWDLVTQNDWHPEYFRDETQSATYGAGGIIFGSILVTVGSMIIAVPLGLGCAIFIAELAPPKVKIFLKTAIELLAGIPSIVYGFFGLTILLPALMNLFPAREKTGFAGSSWLAASLILGIMALPTIVSVTEDALSAVPQQYREASLAMGATKWQTIRKVLVPSSISGITAAVILGMGRAIGETMAVLLVAGNTLAFPEGPWAIFERVRTITATIATEAKEAPHLGDWFHVLFVLGVILFLMTLVINTISGVILKKINERFQPPPKDEEINNISKENIAYSVAYIPSTIDGSLRVQNHVLNDKQVKTIKRNFEVFGKRLILYGCISTLSFALMLVAIVAIITFNYNVILYCSVIGSIIFAVGIPTQVIFLKNIKTLRNQMSREHFSNFYRFILLSSIFVSIALVVLIFGLFSALSNLKLMIGLTTISSVMLGYGLGVEFFAWIRIRMFFIINPIIIKRKAIEGSKSMHLSSLIRFILMVFITIFCALITTSLINPSGTEGLLLWLNQNRVITGLGIILVLVITISTYLTGIFKLGRTFTPPLTEKQQFVKNWFVKIALLLVLVLLFLYAFNWVTVVILIPLIFGIVYVIKKINPKVHQIISYTLITLLTCIVVGALGILIFYIYKGGLEILGTSLLYAVGAIAFISIVISFFKQTFTLKKLFIWIALIVILTAITIPTLYRNGWTIRGEEGIMFFFSKNDPLDIHDGGILNQLLGSIWLIFFSMLVAIPIGIGGGIYLAEYSKPGPFSSIIRSAIDNLNGTPSIVFGIFGWSFFVFFLNFGISLLAGMFTMALMVLPTLMRVTEEAIKAVPQGLKEGSYAMGTTKWQTIRKIVLPVARPSIVTGVVLSMGRVAGETAPILFTCAVLQKRFSWGPFDLSAKPFWKIFTPFGEGLQLLPYHVLDMTTELQDASRAGGTALVLLVLVLVLFSIATFLRLKYKKALK
ncbi:MAG: phosphate ABC transporter permease subunit PstC [Candidatus Lokiarchaeota archaeon]|nr:phosphate ABC transporter permease subunit PstC [Candidatus Lokiarchaeota archaeon]